VLTEHRGPASVQLTRSPGPDLARIHPEGASERVETATSRDGSRHHITPVSLSMNPTPPEQIMFDLRQQGEQFLGGGIRFD
jgi:hypothetical protein